MPISQNNIESCRLCGGIELPQVRQLKFNCIKVFPLF